MTQQISRDGLVPVRLDQSVRAVPPIFDVSGRALVRHSPRLLPMRRISIANTTETALTPSTLLFLSITGSTSSLPVIGATISGAAGVGTLLAVVPGSDGAVSGVLLEVTTPGYVVGEQVSDGAAFQGNISSLVTTVRPVVVAITAFNTHATNDVVLTLRSEPTGTADLVDLILVAAGGRDEWLTEWVGKSTLEFTAQADQAGTVTVNVAWFAELLS